MFNSLKTLCTQSLLSVLGFSFATAASALTPVTSSQDVFAFAPIRLISPLNFKEMLLDKAAQTAAIRDLCTDVNAKFRHYGWRDDACGQIAWRADLKTNGGRPLLYVEFGRGEETTLILGGVHPDELTPIPIAFRIANYLSVHQSDLAANERVLIAPLVNPDGFLKPRASRTNANGIDLNRNFLTFDWYAKARRLWVDRRARAASHYPGYFPNSEIETLFQVQLIDQAKPDKILSIHAPLGFLDYDGPGDGLSNNLTPTQAKAKQLVQTISEKSRNYRVVDYSFYPGSLGNYAGNERGIPTVTLELEKTDPAMVELYWRQFLPGLMQSIHYRFRPQHNQTPLASPMSSEYVRLAADERGG